MVDDRGASSSLVPTQSGNASPEGITTSITTNTAWAAVGPVHKLPTQPPQSFPDFDYHHAFMLATLPRKRSDDPSSTSLACTLVMLAPAILALLNAVDFHAWTFSMNFHDSVPVWIFVGCFVWFVRDKIDQKELNTSLEYLENLRTGKPLVTGGGSGTEMVRPKKWWQLWR